MIDAFLDFLHIDRYSDEVEESRYFVDCYPEVANVGSLERAKIVLERSGLAGARRGQLAMKVAERGSCYIPELNLILVHRLRMPSAARDVARFVHHACRNFEETGKSNIHEQNPEESFYAQTMEHALMDFGARILYPSHPVNEENDLLSLYAEDSADADTATLLSTRERAKVLDCVMVHRDYEVHSRSYAVKPWLLQDVLFAPTPMLALLSKHLGELLGSDLYRAYIEGRFGRSAARSLMFRKLTCGGARDHYFNIVRRVRGRRSSCARGISHHGVNAKVMKDAKEIVEPAALGRVLV